ncbi:unnamed protein product [Mytilus coruscus]|uniref:Uncharacterized protein n=1 Tax=Mytilus coruscus TaxID=42192 RepID=A0A6J8EEY8_MYTCO|nr:unnamed protein product [Mytilus coruscus]
MTTENRTVTTWRDRRHPGETGIKGCRGLAGQSTSSVKKNPFLSCYGQIYTTTPPSCARAGEDEPPTVLETPETTQDRTRTTHLNNGNECICGKVCKNQRGLKIHVGKMGCKLNQSTTQRTGQPDNETLACDLRYLCAAELYANAIFYTNHGPLRNYDHSDHSLHVLYNEEDSLVERSQQVQEDLDNNRQLQEPKRTSDTSKDNIRRKKVKWPNNKSKREWQQFDEDVDAILNTILAGNIDNEKEVVRREGQKNRRESKIAKMRKDLRQLKKRYKQAAEDEKPALSELRDTIRKNMKITRRAERTRKRRKNREKARAEFTSGTFQFTSGLLGKKGNPKREEDLPEIEQLICPEDPEQAFDESKEKKSETLKQFRTISLLNVEGKIFLAILAKRMTNYILSNNYIDIAVQKGGVPGLSGCIEHTSVLSQIIREAKDSK